MTIATKRSRTIYRGGADLPPIDYKPVIETVTDEDYSMGIVSAEAAAELTRDRDTEEFHRAPTARELESENQELREKLKVVMGKVEELESMLTEALEEHEAASKARVDWLMGNSPAKPENMDADQAYQAGKVIGAANYVANSLRRIYA